MSFCLYNIENSVCCQWQQAICINNWTLAFFDRAQVVGWPPIRSYRKNTMASNLVKNGEDDEGKSGAGCLYVKVSMEGAPYLRKVDLKNYNNYMELSSALEKMFSCFTIGILPYPVSQTAGSLLWNRLFLHRWVHLERAQYMPYYLFQNMHLISYKTC